jgi:beta-phosphoglucomutase-like phosphatase (HAD superfamily)
MSKIRAVLFDLDGVLVDATEWHYEALNRALSLFGFSISRYEHLSAYNGLPTRRKLEMLSVEKGLPVALHSLINKIKQVYTREEILSHCQPVFDKEYMLSRLKAEGYRLAVCSNAITYTVDLMLRQAGVFEYFEFRISNEDVVKAKPDPEIYLTAINRLGCDADDVLVVEDAPHGVEAARRAGAHVCQVSGCSEVDYFRIREAIRNVERRPK